MTWTRGVWPNWGLSLNGSWPSVRDRLNRLLAGWSAYFSYGTRASAYRAVDPHVSESVRRFLAKRRKEPGRGARRFSWSEIHGKYGVTQLVQPLNLERRINI
ncbi:MAG TPA: group II intron maturase-specific domain-containing protein [Roseiarcus sp.]|nr:group II intron maturase-specific domain-containing protein [Roseiarcus sp.]